MKLVFPPSLLLMFSLLFMAGVSRAGDCPAPATPVVSAVDSTKVLVSWTAVSGATAYRINVENDNGNPVFFNLERTVSATSFTVSGLRPGAPYKVKVRTECDKDKSDWSNDVRFRTSGSGGNGGGSQVCAIPGGLQMSTDSLGATILRWRAVSGVNGYEVEVESEERTPAFFLDTIITDTVLRLSGLQRGGLYKFKVKSRCPGGNNSDYSAWVFFSPGGSGNGGNGGGGSQSCTVPGGLQVSTDSLGASILRWRRSAGAAFYEVELESEERTPAFFLDTIVIDSVLRLSGLQAGGLYKFKVKSHCPGGSSSTYSAWLFFSPGQGGSRPPESGACQTPGGLALRFAGPNRVVFSWQAIPGARFYEIEVEDGEQTPPYFRKVTLGRNSVALIDFRPGGQYKFKVKARCSNGRWTAYSDWMYFQMPAAAPNPGLVNNPSPFGGIEELSLRLYPNPVHEQLSIEWSNAGTETQLRIFDLSGRLRWSGQVEAAGEGSIRTSVADWQNGYYLLEIRDGNTVRHQRFVVSH